MLLLLHHHATRTCRSGFTPGCAILLCASLRHQNVWFRNQVGPRGWAVWPTVMQPVQGTQCAEMPAPELIRCQLLQLCI